MTREGPKSRPPGDPVKICTSLWSSDSGSAGLLALVGALVILSSGYVIALAVSMARIHTETDAAADLTALAVAGVLLSEDDPCETGRGIAEANGAALRDCRVAGLSASVTVTFPLPSEVSLLVGKAEAVSRATAELRGPDGTELFR